MVLLKAVGHALQKGRHQIDGDKGIQEPVGHQHRAGEEIEQQGPGGLRPLLEALQGDDHQRPHHQRHRHLGQAAVEEGGQLPGALLPQQQGPGEHEEQRHRRRGQGGGQIGEMPHHPRIGPQGPGGGVEVHHPGHAQHPQQVMVQPPSGFGAHNPTAFFRRTDKGGACTGRRR